MCNGNAPAAPESKDLIAIIHPTYHPQLLSGRLRFSNRLPTSTISEWQSVHSHLPSTASKILEIRIHRFGLPIVTTKTTQCDEDDYQNPIMHCFTMNMRTGISDIGERFDLGVGGEGLVGRTISVADEELGVLGQGIIGRI